MAQETSQKQQHPSGEKNWGAATGGHSLSRLHCAVCLGKRPRTIARGIPAPGGSQKGVLPHVSFRSNVTFPQAVGWRV